MYNVVLRGSFLSPNVIHIYIYIYKTQENGTRDIWSS